MNHMNPHLSHSMAAPLAPVPRITMDAFCQTKPVAKIVNEAFKDPILTRAKAGIMEGGLRDAIDYYSKTPTPSVIVLEVAPEEANFLSALDDLATHCSQTTNVIVIGHVNSVRIHRALQDRNVRDYLVVEELDRLDLVRAVSRIYSETSGVDHGHVTAVIGSVGGAGTSTIACNLASNLASLVSSSVLVDLNFGFGAAAFNFNQEPKQDVSEALFTPERIDANLLERLLVQCDDNLAILPAPANLEKTWDIREDAVARIIETLRRDNSNLVLDMPRVWTQWTSLALQVSNEVILVVTPTLLSLRNAQETVAALDRLGKRPRLIVNQHAGSKSSDLSIEDISKSLSGLEPTAVLPFDRALHREASEEARMLAQVQPNGIATLALRELARSLAGVNTLEDNTAAGSGKTSGLAGLMRRFSGIVPQKTKSK
ncbi:AAA family ATPase [Microvirga sp. BT688]|uniref:AAA family ATPase n=1 Tax=Microvirga sp. TaxID=1873136 RepID=UPI0016870165|nr:cellulose synthase operon protein YhjQ/BcsQ [Microvirga sp.]MBD2745778.1 AAA family ATPase [Microvirga sp.]